MDDVVDLTRDLAALAGHAGNPRTVDDTLQRALEYLQAVIPYDLAAVLELRGDALRVRTARGRLDSHKVRTHTLSLQKFPSIQNALETRQARALEEHDHSGGEGDPYDGVLDLPHGHSCMVVPLFAGDRTLGAMTFDRSVCEVYSPNMLHLATVVGQMVSLALVASEQAALLDRLRHRLTDHNKLLEAQTPGGDRDGAVLQRSRDGTMQRLVALAKQAAPTDVPVLIHGETGTGKELLARAIHQWSPRAEGPFVTLNCAALPENLIESELFGHVRGAFSGADKERAGRFVTANGGTLLLDEIGELPPAAQAKLLRVLQEGTFQAVGSDDTIKVDVRILAATHVDLEGAVATGGFREDLLYRLNIFPLTLPPLRERPSDLPLISGEYLASVTRRTGRGPWTLTQAVLDDLAARPWPGNVRELVNVLERATILCAPGDLSLHGQLPPVRASAAVAANREEAGGRVMTLADNERAHIERALRHCGGKIGGKGGAAELLDVNASTLKSRMRKLGVQRD